jgi:hypothetical protein
MATWMGLMANLPPWPIPTGIVDLKQMKIGCSRNENSIPEINITKKNRDDGYIIKVIEKGDRPQASFPWASNN